MSIHEHFTEQELNILKARADRAARIDQRDDAKKTEVRALQCTMGNESYALPVEFVRVVYENMTVVPVPCTPQFVAGIANMRGRIMPVLDLATLLNVPSGKGNLLSTLIVISTGEFSLALQVERVDEMLIFPASSVDPLPIRGTTLEHADYLQGILPDGSVLLNLTTILEDPALIVETAMM